MTPDFNFNFLQMAAQMGMMGNPGMQQFHHHGHRQGAPGSEMQQLGQEMQHLEADLQHLTGDLSGQTGQGGMSGMGSGMGNPFGGGSGMSGMGNPFGAGLGMDGGMPFGGGWGNMGGTCPSQQSPWTVSNTGQGQDQVDLGKYTLNLNKANSEWNLTNKETGATTKVWGDPHVQGAGGNWDFKHDMSFQLDDGTRIGVHTVPYGNGQTLSAELDITNGSHGMKVTGLAGNDSAGLQVADGLNGYALDAQNMGLPELYEAGGAWQDFSGQTVNQSLATAEAL